MNEQQLTRHTVGVLGGMGPEATVDFMSQVIAMTPASGDQEHVRMLIDNNPQVPDRQQAMATGEGGPVCTALTAMARHLESGGAEFLVMPCNTAHAFVHEAVEAVSIPFVSIIDVTIDAIVERLPDARSIGLLATNACIRSEVYAQAAESRGLRLVLPGTDAQDRCMQLIFAVKAGDTGDEIRTGMAALAGGLQREGADVIIAGCTEIPLVLADEDIELPLISSTEMLARRTVELATGVLPLPTK